MAERNKTTKLYPNNIVIRKQRPEDKQPIRTLCCDTAYFGEPCEQFFSDRALLADLIMKYYTDYEPQHTWVAEHNGEIIGYISAYFDEARYNRTLLFKIIPVSIIRALIRGRVWSTKTCKSIVYNLKAFILKEFKLAKMNHKKFPVHIHQNIKDGFRGKGIGSRLLSALLEEVNREKMSGIKFRALRQEPQFVFFEKYGFRKYDCKRVTSWEAWFKKTPLYFMEYGKICCD